MKIAEFRVTLSGNVPGGDAEALLDELDADEQLGRALEVIERRCKEIAERHGVTDIDIKGV